MCFSKDYVTAKQRVFNLYNDELSKTGSDEIALESALQEIKRCDLCPQFEEGLKNEIYFYYQYRKVFQLEPALPKLDKYLHIDFKARHPQTGKLIFIDVTKRLDKKFVKKAKSPEYWKEIKTYIKFMNSEAEYLIAVYDYSKNKLYSLGPILLPVHDNGYLGVFIAKLEHDQSDNSLYEIWSTVGIVYFDIKDLVGKDDVSVIDYEIINSNIIDVVSDPVTYLLLQCKLSPVLKYSNRYYELYEEFGIPTDTPLSELVYDERQALAYGYRNMGVVLSAVIDEIEILTYGSHPKNIQVDYEYILTWIHPAIREKIRFILGNLLENPNIVNADYILREW